MHPLADLSAYLDGALGRDARASVDAHISTCGSCSGRLAELRGTARLIAALPAPVPARSLVPRISVPVWVAPLRTLSTFASGAALFLFIASAVAAYFPFGSGAPAGTAAQPAAAPAGAQAPAATAAADQTSALSSASGTPQPGAGFAVITPTVTPAPAPQRSTQDAAKEVGGARQEPPATGPREAEERSARGLSFSERSQLGLSPWMWLAVALGFGFLAFGLHRRLRTA